MADVLSCFSDEAVSSPRYEFDAFLSYSTIPDYKLVQKTESFLERFHSMSFGRKLKLRALKICMDGSDFSLAKMRTAGVGNSIVEDLLYEHLAKSRLLLVFCSSNSMASAFVGKEIEWWLTHRDPESLLLIVTEGTNISSQPDRFFSQRILAAGLHSRPWYDFRGFRRRDARKWSHVRDAEAERVQLAAHVYGETAGRLYPTWQRMRDRRRRFLALLAVAAVVGLLAGAVWLGWTLTDAYQIRQIAQHPPLANSSLDRQLLAGLARSGHLAEARDIAMRDDQSKIERLNVLGKELLLEGNSDTARSIYELALQSRSDGQILMPPVPSEVLANSILLGARAELVDAMKTNLNGSFGTPLADAALELAKGGMFDRAVALARSISNDFEHRRETTLIELAKMAPNRTQGIELLNETWTALKPPEKQTGILPSPDRPDLELRELATAYAHFGQEKEALDVADTINFERIQVHLQLAETFAFEHKWPMVQRAVTQAGPIYDSFLKTLSIRSCLEKMTVDDMLQFTELLEPDDQQRGELLLSTTASYVDPVVGTGIPNLAAIQRMVSAGTALVAKQSKNVRIELSIAKGWIAGQDWPQARQHLANAAQQAINARQWDSLEDIVSLFIKAKAGDDDLKWIERIPAKELRDKTRTRVGIERQYGSDGRPLREWLEANNGGGKLGGPYEQWFAKCLARGDVKTAIEASKGIDNEGRRGSVMLGGVRELLKTGQAVKAYDLMNAIPLYAKPGVTLTFDEDKFIAIVDVAPALAKLGAVDRAVASVRQITAPLLRARSLGVVSAVLMPTSRKQARELLDETFRTLSDIGDVDKRDRELAAITKSFLRSI